MSTINTVNAVVLAVFCSLFITPAASRADKYGNAADWIYNRKQSDADFLRDQASQSYVLPSNNWILYLIFVNLEIVN